MENKNIFELFFAFRILRCRLPARVSITFVFCLRCNLKKIIKCLNVNVVNFVFL